MTQLPERIKAIQDKLRPRVEAQTSRFEAMTAEAFAEELAEAEVAQDVSARDALTLLAAHGSPLS